MMDDRLRWNEKHKNPSMPSEPSPFLQKYIHEYVQDKKALDIACGTGRHTHYLADLGYWVDALDISDYGLSQIRITPTIKTIETDLTTYTIDENHYDVIININYLERNLYESMINGLKSNGIVIFETFVNTDSPEYAQPSNLAYLLRSNELPEIFSSFNILEYEEHDAVNIHGEKVKIASFAGKK